MNIDKLDALGTMLAQASMTMLVRVCRQEAVAATDDELEATLAAMRANAKSAIARLLDDAQQAPWIAEDAFRAAALELAEAGAEVLRGRVAQRTEKGLSCAADALRLFPSEG